MCFAKAENTKSFIVLLRFITLHVITTFADPSLPPLPFHLIPMPQNHSQPLCEPAYGVVFTRGLQMPCIYRRSLTSSGGNKVTRHVRNSTTQLCIGGPIKTLKSLANQPSCQNLPSRSSSGVPTPNPSSPTQPTSSSYVPSRPPV